MTIVSCQEKYSNINRNLCLEDYDQFSSIKYALNSRSIRVFLDSLIREDKDSTIADYGTKGYYSRKGDFLWIDRIGIDHRADTLLCYLRDIDSIGFSPRKFSVKQIETDLERARSLNFDTNNQINLVFARLEYYLTKAYLRYSLGQRYGFINPRFIFNHLDKYQVDSVNANYASLFDLKMDLPTKTVIADALHKIYNNSVSEYLQAAQPRQPLYYRLKKLLNSSSTQSDDHLMIMANMERCRWRLEDDMFLHQKYITVNIPSFRLDAVDGDKRLSMRVGCGTLMSKTPLLTGRIHRIDVNPQWIIPRSIIRSNIIHHLGDSAYFANHHYFIRERRTGKIINQNRLNASKLLSGDYSVIQKGGEGNALGRIIFRFDNNFAIYLHDTSSPGVFSREDRGVTHGCVRVEKPFDLAVFLLSNKDHNTIDKIQYSISVDVSSINHSDIQSKANIGANTRVELDRSKLIKSVKVDPQVPLFITYFTLFPDQKGEIQKFTDVYGYDRVINNYLNNFK